VFFCDECKAVLEIMQPPCENDFLVLRFGAILTGSLQGGLDGEGCKQNVTDC